MLPDIIDPNLLVGTNTADDAGIYRLREDLALVFTIDILTPVVNDPETFGMIAAASTPRMTMTIKSSIRVKPF